MHKHLYPLSRLIAPEPLLVIALLQVNVYKQHTGVRTGSESRANAQWPPLPANAVQEGGSGTLYSFLGLLCVGGISDALSASSPNPTFLLLQFLPNNSLHQPFPPETAIFALCFWHHRKDDEAKRNESKTPHGPLYCDDRVSFQ